MNPHILHRFNTISNTISLLMDPLFQYALDDSTLKFRRLLKISSKRCCLMVQFAPAPAHGLPPSTWSLKSRQSGDWSVTTVISMLELRRIPIHSHISMTFQPIYMVATSFPRLISKMPSISYQLLKRTWRRLLFPPLLDPSNILA